MTFESVIKCVVALGAVLGGLDYLFGGRYGIGNRFREAFQIAGNTMMSMIGIMSIAPTFAFLIKPVIVPLCRNLGLDPSALGMFLPCDIGGYQLALSLTDSPLVAQMFGLNAASIIGGTIVFSIPFGMAVIRKENHSYFFQGTLIALMTAPIGTAASGIILGIDIKTILINVIPVFLFAATIIVGFVLIRKKMVSIVNYFGKLITVVGIISIIIGFVSYLTGWKLLPEYTPIMVNMEIVCGIVIFLAGAMPLTGIVTEIFKLPLGKIGRRFRLLAPDTVGLLATIASNVPMYAMANSMSRRGLVINSAWGITAASLLGGQTSIVLALAPEALMAFMLGKLASSLTALLIALWFVREDSFEPSDKDSEGSVSAFA